MGPGLFWRMLGILAVALALPAQPARAQNPPNWTDADMLAAERAPRPNIDSYVPSVPTYLCSEAERQAFLALLEKASAQIDKDADRARDYYGLLRRTELTLEGDERRQAVRNRQYFEHGDPNAVTGEGPLHEMTVTQPRKVQDAIDAVRKLPIRDCTSMDDVQRERPLWDPVSLPPLPPRLCSETERDAYRQRLNAARAAIRAQIDRQSAYLDHAQRHIRFLSGLKPPPADLEAISALMTLETDWGVDQNGRLSQMLFDLDKLEKALDAMPIVNCDDPLPAQEVTPPPPAGRGPVPERPALPAEPRAIAPRPICTEEDRRALLAEYDAAIRNADARLVMANAHLVLLSQLSQTLTRGHASYDQLRPVNLEARSYQLVVNALYAATKLWRDRRAAIAARPLDPCDPPARPAETVPSPGGEAKTPETGVVPGTTPNGPKPVPTPGGGKKACLPGGKRQGRAPISVGSNGKVGSGARAKKKLVSTLGGIAGGLLGGGGSGGGGGKGGPPVAKCKIKDSEKTLFTDPISGLALRVGAKRSGDTVVVFADVAKSPDSGTFQAGWVEKPDGALEAPARADICEMWGEWSLTVSWTRETYVDGNLVSRQTGGYREGGLFSLPGMISTDDAPAGLWKQLGFSNASHGARAIAMSYRIARGVIGPMPLVIHVTQPSRNPVTTVPFDLEMTEGPGGFSFAQASYEPCPPEDAPVM